DHRVLQIDKMRNVSVYRASRLEAEHVREMGCARVVVATGSTWRRDGTGPAHTRPVPGFEEGGAYTPDDVLAAAAVKGPVVVFGDDHFYMGGLMAEKLRQAKLAVTLVTPAESASSWTQNTLEHGRIQTRLIEAGVTIVAYRTVTAFAGDHVETACVF